MGFVALTALVCGGMMLAEPDGSTLGLASSLLTGTPFKSFLIPGLVLMVAVGFSNLTGVFTLMHRHRRSFIFSMTAGLLINGWIIVQAVFFGISHWLQFLYLLIGAFITLISLQLRGKELI
jgi:hypothetical protein